LAAKCGILSAQETSSRLLYRKIVVIGVCCASVFFLRWGHFMKFSLTRKYLVALFTCSMISLCSLWAYAKTSGMYPVIHFRDIPSQIQTLYSKNEPDLGEVGSCATAFDSFSDEDKMVFTCSIYIKILAEGERRAIKRCQEMKEAKGMKSECHIITR